VVDWKRLLKADPIDWLLEEDNPSVRFFTLTGLLNKPHNGSLARKAKDQIMQVGVVPKILSRQKEGGYWETAEDFYVRTKYNGTVWQLIILAELGADKDDTRIKKACEFILQWSQDRESGGFSYRGSAGNGGFHSAVVPCLTGNMVWSLLRFGYFDDPRVRRGIDWIVEYQRFDDAIEKAPRGWPYDKREPCWGKHTCHMGVVKTLKALAEIPVRKRTQRVNKTIENAAEYLLVHNIHKRSHDLSRVSKPGWLKFGFPLMYNTDVLEILGILTGLGYRDSRMQEALELVISKQDEQGRWKLESTYNGRFQVNIEQKGKPSKWVTLNALRVLKGFYD
jgi:hypothetical protein